MKCKTSTGIIQATCWGKDQNNFKPVAAFRVKCSICEMEFRLVLDLLACLGCYVPECHKIPQWNLWNGGEDK